MLRSVINVIDLHFPNNNNNLLSTGVVILKADVQQNLIKQNYYKPYNPFTQVYPLRTANDFVKK